jgi:hypothetical protein
MNLSQAAEIVLVRAVEETRPDVIPPEALVDALTAAGDLEAETSWLSRRATYLVERFLAAYRPLLSMTDALNRGTVLIFVVPMVVGMLSNYLGPSSRIHVLFNPIAALITWNLGVYVWLVGWLVWWRRRRPAQSTSLEAGDTVRSGKERRHSRSRPPAPRVRSSLLARWTVGRLVPVLWLRFSKTAGEARDRASDFATVGRRFWSHWVVFARPVLALNARRLFHWAAVALTVGAVVGMYARGLVFEYNVVWRSTFIRQPEMVVWILRCLLGPASILLGIPFPSEDDATALMTPAGAPAAIWIHLYATSAVALVVVPRTMLAIGAGIRRRAITSRLQLDMGDEYYRELIDVARTRQMKLVAEAIDTDVRAASAGFSEAVATFVCERLYDARIIPKLQDFRHRGGRLADLEEAIRADCESFQPELSRYLPVAQHDFERSLAGRIERTIGTELKVIPVPGSGLTSRVGEVSGGSVQDVGWSLGRGLADVIGVTLSGAVAVTAGTVSGGFGKGLGVSIVAGLLGTSGPVGFMIGAVGGLVVAGAGWWLGREKLTRSMKDVRIPSIVARGTLWRLGAIAAEGRKKCHASVKDLMDRELEVLTPKISAQVWTSVKPLLGEQQRKERPSGATG